ncbi:MAG: glycosyl transferase [Verrucomicrobia bacterium]|nr:glycosyl transferase [Verrucomicrobiota bacterium]
MPSDLRDWARRLHLGSLAYHAWHRPRAALVRVRREGGLLEQWRDDQGRRAMQRAAARLPPLGAPAPDAPEVCFLTGRRFWYQTAFCFWSLRHQAGCDLRPVFLDDGTIDPVLRAECHRLFPGAVIEQEVGIERRLDAHLPEKRFPTLRAQRRTYKHLRKLTDAHAGRAGWRLVLDSDMLFFRRPDALLAWLAAPERPVHMLDVQDAYGYPAATLQNLADRPVPACVNVGICGFRSDTLDWERLESWAAQLIAHHGTSYYLEQALVALLAAQSDPLRLPRSDYLLMPDVSECQRPTAALHHYVDLSKRGYFRHAWRHVVSCATGPVR